MKAIKLLFFVVAMAFATSANAQFVSSGAGRTGGSSSSSSSLEKSNYFLFDFRVGSVAKAAGFGLNFGAEKRYNDYIAWDYVNVEYAAWFNSPAEVDILSLKTGLRAFTPSFANDLLRVYSNIALGYTCVLQKYWSYNYSYYGEYYYKDDEWMGTDHGFGLTFGVGLQIKKKYSIGYSLQYETGCSTKSHLATFGFAF